MSKLIALPLGNPDSPGLLTGGVVCNTRCISGRIAFEGDYVFKRTLRINRATSYPVIELSELYTNSAVFTLNIFEIADVFAKVGTANFYMDGNADNFRLSNFTPNGQRLMIGTTTNVAWSVGGRLVLLEKPHYALGLTGEYYRTKQSVNNVLFQVVYGVDPGIDMTYYSGQVGGGAVYHVNSYIHPYVGFRWSTCNIGFDNAIILFSNNRSPPSTDGRVQLYDLKTRKNWGYSVGTTITFQGAAAVTGEARFGDETALMVNGQLRF